jgi:hypothetical protein
MATKTNRQKLKELKEFLVPEKRKNRLVKDWSHMAELDNGACCCYLEPNYEGATNFCVIGGWRHLFKSEMPNFLDSKMEKLGFNAGVPHTPKEVRKLLDTLASNYKEN